MVIFWKWEIEQPTFKKRKMNTATSTWTNLNPSMAPIPSNPPPPPSSPSYPSIYGISWKIWPTVLPPLFSLLHIDLYFAGHSRDISHGWKTNHTFTPKLCSSDGADQGRIWIVHEIFEGWRVEQPVDRVADCKWVCGVKMVEFGDGGSYKNQRRWGDSVRLPYPKNQFRKQ